MITNSDLLMLEKVLNIISKDNKHKALCLELNNFVDKEKEKKKEKTKKQNLKNKTTNKEYHNTMCCLVYARKTNNKEKIEKYTKILESLKNDIP